MNKKKQQQQEPDLCHSRDNGMVFSTVMIERQIRNKSYVAKIHVKHPDIKIVAEVDIYGKSVDECISKTGRFMQTSISESEYKLVN